MMKNFKKTIIQKAAILVLSSVARYVMLYGGSRSGKTFIIIYAMFVRAAKCAGTRHLIVRLKFNHAKTSLWMDTIPKVLSLCFPNLQVSYNNTDYCMTLSNGSEIWIAGLDDKIRTEKILGKEYSTIFFNECSQITRSAVDIALTRLAQKSDLTKKAYFDENPPSKKHWSYWYFIKKVHPTDERELDENKYASMVMNPKDNLENIDEDYITEVLSELGERDKARFERGEFIDSDDGLIYYAFNRDDHVRDFPVTTNPVWWCGMDFNVNPLCAVIGWIDDNVLYIWDEVYQKRTEIPKGQTATESAGLKIIKKYGKGVTLIPDSTGKKQTSNASKSDIQILKNLGFNVKALRNPFRVDRYSGANSAFTQMRVVIHKRCKYTIRDMESVFYKEGTDQPDTTDPNSGHIADACTYLIYRTVNPLLNHTTKIMTYKR
jgi:PBSX family phage terminase large subunit